MIQKAFYALWGAMASGMLIAATVKAGPPLELRLNPITAAQHIEAVERTSDNRLCWKRWTTKLRDAEPWNFDVFLDRPWSGDRTFPEVKDQWDGHSWHTKGAVPAGQTREQDQCVALPPDLKPGEPITLSQTIHYPGFHGWWDLPVALPTISYTVPGEPAHDVASPPTTVLDAAESPSP